MSVAGTAKSNRKYSKDVAVGSYREIVVYTEPKAAISPYCWVNINAEFRAASGLPYSFTGQSVSSSNSYPEEGNAGQRLRVDGSDLRLSFYGYSASGSNAVCDGAEIRWVVAGVK